MRPLVTVLMGVYNEEQYIKLSIDSILAQSLTDFEFLIINDGSTDNTLDIIQHYGDPRIQLINNEENIGLTKSLNKGIELAKGKYLARMDADDIAYPDRLETQISFLEKHPNIDVCGCWVQVIGDKKGMVRWKLPRTQEEIEANLLFANALHHPTVVFRKSIFDKVENHYNEGILYGQDYELWTRLIQRTQIYNIPKPLLQYRLYDISENKIKTHYQLSIAKDIKINYHEILLERVLSASEREAIANNWVSWEIVKAWLKLTKTILQGNYLSNKGKLIYANNWINMAGKVIDAGFKLSFKDIAPYLFYSFNAPIRKLKLFWKVFRYKE